MAILWILAALAFAYLLGSVSFAVIFSKAFANKDVRDFGSGSAGMTNVIRAIGILPGILTFVCDALKGFVVCFAAKNLFFQNAFEISGEWWANPIYGMYLCGVICMLGHMFPVFFGFKGGKGVATSVGIFAVCCPIAIALGLAVFVLCVAISKIVSLSSLIATVMVVTGVVIWHSTEAAALPQIILGVLMGILVFYKHKDNISRLIKGEEKRLVARKGEKKNG